MTFFDRKKSREKMESEISQKLFELKFFYLLLLFEKKDMDQIVREWYASSYTGHLGRKTKK